MSKKRIYQLVVLVIGILFPYYVNFLKFGTLHFGNELALFGFVNGILAFIVIIFIQLDMKD